MGGSEAFTGGGSEHSQLGVSEAFRGHRRHLEALGGHQRRLEALGGTWRQSEAIRGHRTC